MNTSENKESQEKKVDEILNLMTGLSSEDKDLVIISFSSNTGVAVIGNDIASTQTQSSYLTPD